MAKAIVYKIELERPLAGTDLTKLEKYRYNGLGYLRLLWRYQGAHNYNTYGFVALEHLQRFLGPTLWQRFKSGERYFVLNKLIEREQEVTPVSTIQEKPLNTRPEFIQRLCDGELFVRGKDGMYTVMRSKMKKPHKYTYERLMEDPRAKGAFKIVEIK